MQCEAINFMLMRQSISYANLSLVAFLCFNFSCFFLRPSPILSRDFTPMKFTIAVDLSDCVFVLLDGGLFSSLNIHTYINDIQRVTRRYFPFANPFEFLPSSRLNAIKSREELKIRANQILRSDVSRRLPMTLATRVGVAYDSTQNCSEPSTHTCPRCRRMIMQDFFQTQKAFRILHWFCGTQQNFDSSAPI